MISTINQTGVIFLDIDIHIVNNVSVFSCIDLVLEVHYEGITRVVVDSESFH